MTRTRSRAVLFALFATILAVVGTSGVAAMHDSPGNWTVVPGNHQPGADAVDYKHFAVGQAAFDGSAEGRGLETAAYMVLTWDEGSFADCTLFNAQAFGFDRDNDDPGTETDDFAGTYVEESFMGEDKMWMDFNDEDDAGPTTPFARNDQFVAHQTSCYQNPDSAGWYRVFGWMNGTDYAGEFYRAELYSHYFYICDCESYDAAVDEMGPPPSQQAEETPTPTATVTATETAQKTTTDDGSTETTTETTAEETTTAETATATTTAEPTTVEDTTAAQTDGGGPGFTATTGIVALLAVVVLWIRRQ